MIQLLWSGSCGCAFAAIFLAVISPSHPAVWPLTVASILLAIFCLPYLNSPE